MVTIGCVIDTSAIYATHGQIRWIPIMASTIGYQSVMYLWNFLRVNLFRNDDIIHFSNCHIRRRSHTSARYALRGFNTTSPERDTRKFTVLERNASSHRENVNFHSDLPPCQEDSEFKRQALHLMELLSPGKYVIQQGTRDKTLRICFRSLQLQ